MRTVPLWVWATVIGGGLLFAAVAMEKRVAYWSGVADSAGGIAAGLSLKLDSTVLSADSLLAVADSARERAEKLRQADAMRIARLERERDIDHRAADSMRHDLEAQIAPSQLPRLQMMVAAYEATASKADSIIAAERSGRAAERLRADVAGMAILRLEEVIEQQGQRDRSRVIEIEALRKAASPGFALRLKADWWLAAGGLAVGFVLGGR